MEKEDGDLIMILKKGMHINVEDFSKRKGINAIKISIPFDGDENTFISYLKHLNK